MDSAAQYELSKAITQIVLYFTCAGLMWWRAHKRGWRGWFWALFFLLIPPLSLLFYWLYALREKRKGVPAVLNKGIATHPLIPTRSTDGPNHVH